MELDEYLEEWFEDETEEAGLYMAMARQAEREGYPGIARQFRETAIQEAEHAGIAAELAGKIGSTKENLEKMIGGEDNANKDRINIADKADEPAKSHLITTAEDESRHKKALKGLKERL
ncbi:MAG: rubrerythrin family protein [Candidatus Nanohaloarchaeota archaeon QJJ-9]|nr:rubrerythrin family protein [Candidatus Nanohaloarchaeota archaeon QJJ-9]